MKVVVAMDSLKGSLTSMEAGFAVKKGILAAKPDACVVVKPLADGGEGTTDALIEGLGGEKIFLRVTGPLGLLVNCSYGYLKDTKTAVMEMASAAGILLLGDQKKDPFRATTFGVGEMINDAISKGCRQFMIGIGGSATNDGGMGMLRALGYNFLDENNQELKEGVNALSKVAIIDSSRCNPLLSQCHFEIACDVTNPLCGANGAAWVYGPQKGASPDMLPLIDKAMSHYAHLVERSLGCSCQNRKGAGAAGGLGFAFLSFLHARLTPGIDLILRAVDLEKELKDTDIVITGEGRLDHQTAMGKAPIGVAKLAKEYKVKVIAFAGSVTKEAGICNHFGIDAFFPIVRGVTTLEEAMIPQNAAQNLCDSVEQVFRML